MIWITYVIFKATHNLIYQGDDMDLRDTCHDKPTLSSKRAAKTQIGLPFRTTRSRVVYTFLIQIVSLNRRKKKQGQTECIELGFAVCKRYGSFLLLFLGMEPQRQKTYLRTCAASEDSDQPAHSRSLIRIFTRRILDSQGCICFSCGQQRF